MSATLRIAMAPADAARLDGLIDNARRNAWAERLMARDTTLWSNEPAVRAAIEERLGWLDAPEHFTLQIPALEAFGEAIRVAGFGTAVVMGMGGSSLAPEVLHEVFGTAPGYIDLRVLDSTDPVGVSRVVDDLDPLQTLWIVASKSGTTTEPLAFMADAWARVEAALDAAGSDQRPGEFFAAITDPGRSLDSIPHHDELRERFLNPPDIGGRYSALTYVGLVPASLIGLDLDALLAPGATVLGECREPEPADNPALHLGLAIGGLALGGRDKLTFIADPSIASFGAWVEQLIAESTGKHGVGIVPVVGEPLGPVAEYGADRVFVSLELAGSGDAAEGVGAEAANDGTTRAGLLEALEAAGHPVIRIGLDDPFDLGGEALRWEVATAFAGAVLGIDPFDQPNVEEAKELTRRVLAGAGQASPAEREPALAVRGLGEARLAEALGGLIRGRRPPEYLAIQAFIAPTPERDAAFTRIRAVLRRRSGLATTAGYGPRFLHSTGQLHKGGPPTGSFLQLTSDHPVDREIPGWPYRFGQLIDAQARGDRDALRSHDRPVVEVHLGADPDADLTILERAIARALD